MSHLRSIIEFASRESEDDWVRANLVYERKEIWYNTEYAGDLNEETAFKNIFATMDILKKLNFPTWSIFINTELVYEPE